jgi:MraZ protein
MAEKNPTRGLDLPGRQDHRGPSATASEADFQVASPFVLRGCFVHSLDDKGRVSVPAGFRQALSGGGITNVVVTNFVCDGARCIEGYAEPEWNAFEKRLRAKSRFDPQLRKLENYYLARAALCPIDSAGRINIPSHLRAYAGIERDLVFTSALHGFRIWDTRVWDLIFKDAESSLLADPSLFMDVDR